MDFDIGYFFVADSVTHGWNRVLTRVHTGSPGLLLRWTDLLHNSYLFGIFVLAGCDDLLYSPFLR
jgi:hypothetical protein